MRDAQAGASARGAAGRGRRRLDIASLVLLLVGLASGILGGVLMARGEVHPVVLLPSLVAAVTGATHLTKLEAPRDSSMSDTSRARHAAIPPPPSSRA